MIAIYWQAKPGGLWILQEARVEGSGLEKRVAEWAKQRKVGRLAAVWIAFPIHTSWTLPGQLTRLNVLCKAMLGDWKRIRRSGRAQWIKHDPRQGHLFERS